MSSYLDTPEPESSRKYFKPKEPGEYRLRFLEEPVVGFVGWKNKKPVRKEYGEPWAASDTDDEKEPKLFWAAPVWNCDAKQVQVWEITQKSIRSAIKKLATKKSWGKITGYDIILEREGTGMDDTKYSVTPDEKCAISHEIEEAWNDVQAFGRFNINELFVDGDPFDAKTPASRQPKAKPLPPDESQPTELPQEDLPF